MARKYVLPVVLLFFVIGCAGNPVSVELPLNHPSDPGAYESRFILPPDPFGTEMTSTRPKGHDQSESAAGRHKARGDLFESPAGQSAPLEQERKDVDSSSSEMPHSHHNMEQGQ